MTSSPARTSSATEDAAWTPGVSAESAAAVDDPTATPLGFGVGARVTAAVMSEDYARILTDALSRLDLTGLVHETEDVSTYLGGHETHLQRALIDLAEALARTGHHATLSVLLSRGCPGEVACELPGGDRKSVV